MKKRIFTILILSALICATGLSGCKESGPTNTETETTTTETSISTTVTTEAITITTEATTVVTEPTTTEAETQAPTEKPTEPPKQSNNSSSNNQQSNKNDEPQEVVTPTQSQEKPNNKPNNKPITKPNTSQTVTDDTKLPHSELSTEANMQRFTSEITAYYKGLGMTEDTSLDTSAGWLFAYQGELNTTAVRSYNEQLQRIMSGLDDQVNALLSMSGADYGDIRFHCYYQMQADGEYHIYFCYG